MEKFKNLTDIQKILVTLIAAILLYVLSTSVSFIVISSFNGKSGGSDSLVTSLPGPASIVDEDPNEPRTEKCPLDGALHTKRAREAWEKRLPLAVMIENHEESRPQSGLSSADVIYEAVAEGGITRFMAIFYCNLGDIQVGPVRSARTYFLDWVSEYNDPVYAHVGGANQEGPANALGQIQKYKIKTLNQFGIGFPTYWRDYQRLGRPVATEHTMYSTTQKLWEVSAKKGWVATTSGKLSWNDGFTPWKFKDDSKSSNPSMSSVAVSFWENQSRYKVEWSYDVASNTYKRKNGGDNHLDMNNKQQIAPKNIVIQYQRESNANDGYPGNVHLLYGTIGSGKALFFMDGKVTEGKWSKASRTARTKYTGDKGKEVEFNAGQIWIQTVPEGSKVSY